MLCFVLFFINVCGKTQTSAKTLVSLPCRGWKNNLAVNEWRAVATLYISSQMNAGEQSGVTLMGWKRTERRRDRMEETVWIVTMRWTPRSISSELEMDLGVMAALSCSVAITLWSLCQLNIWNYRIFHTIERNLIHAAPT